MLPLNYSLQFNNFLLNKIPPKEFEAWLFQESELEEVLGNNLYIALISLQFSSPHIRIEVQNLINGWIDFDQVQKIEIIKLLEACRNKSKAPIELIEELYNHASKGHLRLGSHDLIGNFNETGKSARNFLVGLNAIAQWAKIEEVAPDFKNWVEKIIQEIKL
jgi:hypothetical protein